MSGASHVLRNIAENVIGVLTIVLTGFATLGVQAQTAATVALNNYDALIPIYYRTAATLAPKDGTVFVQLLGGPVGGQLEPVTLAGKTNAVFPLDSPGYFDVGYGVVSGVAANGQAQCKLRAWKGAPTFEAATEKGETALFTQNTGSWDATAQPPAIPSGPALALPSSIIMVAGVVAPSIVTHPQSTTVAAGGNVNLSVVASGSSPLGYQWQYYGMDIPGAIGASLVFNNIQTSQSGQYRVVVSNPGGSTISQAATVTVLAGTLAATVALNNYDAIKPIYYRTAGTLAPKDGTVFVQLLGGPVGGQLEPVTLAGKTNAVFPLDSPGYFDVGYGVVSGVAANGQAQCKLRAWKGAPTFEAATEKGETALFTQNTGSWDATAQPPAIPSGPALALPSSIIMVAGVVAPSIVTHPQSTTVAAGGNVNLSVVASGSSPLGYQWQYYGMDIPGATGASLVFNNIQTSQSGQYRVVVSNPGGTTISQAATVTVLAGTLAATVALNNYDALKPIYYRTAGTLAPKDGTVFVQLLGGPVGGQLEPVTLAGKTNAVFPLDSPGYFDVGYGVVSGVAANGQAQCKLRAWKGAPTFEAATEKGETALFTQNTGSWDATAQPPAIPSGPALALPSSIIMVAGVVAPSIVTHPQSTTVAAGGNVNLSVVASGSSPLGYQWQYYGMDIPGAIGASLVFNNIQTSQSGQYRVVVSNPGGSTISQAATVTVLAGTLAATVALNNYDAIKPIYYRTAGTLAPKDGTVFVQLLGGPVGGQLEPVTLAGKTNAVFPLDSPGYFDAGYGVVSGVAANGQAQCKLRAWKGAPTFEAATEKGETALFTQNTGSWDATAQPPAIPSGPALALPSAVLISGSTIVPPAIGVQPQNRSVNAGSTAIFTVTASGTLPLIYQWQFNGVNISGATNATLSRGGVSANEGNYTVKISNAAGSVTSAVAVMKVIQPPSIVSQPQGRTVALGANVTFAVTASGTAPFTFQWMFNGVNIANATSATLARNGVQASQAGNYTVRISNSAGSVTSVSALLRILIPPSIASQSGSRTNVVGSDATFSVVATGSAPFNYQWSFNGAVLPGRTNATLILRNVAKNNEGSYRVTVGNAVGSVYGATVSLTVNQPPTATIVSPVAGGLYYAPTNLTVAVSAGDLDGSIQKVEWFQNGILQGTIATAPFRWTWNNVAEGIYTLTARATDNRGASTVSAAVDIAVLSRPPANDMLASRIRISGVAMTVTGSNVGATKEVGEPNHAHVTGGKSVWWEWTPAAGGIAAIATTNSGFDTVLAVYTGTAWSNLVEVADNDDYGGNKTSKVTFNALAGVRYLIAVDGYHGSQGDIALSIRLNRPPTIALNSPVDGSVYYAPAQLTLSAAVNDDKQVAQVEFYQGSKSLAVATAPPFTASVTGLTPGHYVFSARAADNEGLATTSAPVAVTVIRPLPSNDAFTSRIGVSGRQIRVSGNNLGATREMGEPLHVDKNGTNSVWWTWTAPASGFVTLDTVGSDFDTLLAVYTGSAVGSLTPVARDDDSGGNATSKLIFKSVAGTVYQIAVDGYNGAAGQIVLNLALNEPPLVSIASPTNGSSFTAPANIFVTISASDNYGSVTAIWLYQNGTLVGQATGSPYSILWKGVAKGRYSLIAKASDDQGAASESDPIAIEVKGVSSPPKLVAVPKNQSVAVGGDASFSVTADGTPPFRYQWEFKGINLEGETNDTLILKSVQIADEGQYSVTVANDAGSLTSPTATLKVLTPPLMVTQPQSQKLAAGASVSLSVHAKGSEPMRYQWSFNGVDLTGATNEVLELKNIQPANAGNYVAVARNGAGEAASSTALLTVVALAPAQEPPSVPRDDFWITDGEVRAIVETNGIVYLGGEFNYIGPNLGSAAVFDLESGQADRSFPRVDGDVRAIVSDGGGGWYIGGSFTTAGGLARTNLARVRSDRTVDTSWAPNPNAAVLALTLADGALYVGGQYTQIAGQARTNLAAVSATSGAVTGWSPNPDGAVNALAIFNGQMYVGGSFSKFDGLGRKRLAAVGLADGKVTGWKPEANYAVFALAMGDGVLYAGGAFNQVGGVVRQKLAALDLVSGTAKEDWNPGADDVVRALAVADGVVYAGGSFNTLGGEGRSFAGAVDARTGALTEWKPEPDNAVSALLPDGLGVFVGGEFLNIGGQPRNRLAHVSAADGLVSAWDPNLNQGVYALARASNYMLAGGRFNSAGGRTRHYIGALDAVTGVATDWDPSADGPVNALAVSGDKVFAGGAFVNIGGKERHYLAALDLESGLAANWLADTDDNVYALAMDGATLYLGGNFTTVNGQARERIASVNPALNQLNPLNPGVDETVLALAVKDGVLYAGGDFTRLGGPRQRLGAVNATSGQLLAWNPNADRRVTALAISGSVIYAAGFFSEAGGQTRHRLVQLNDAGDATDWNPNVTSVNSGASVVNILALADGMVYAGGLFKQVGGQARNNLAAIRVADGGAADWNPNADGEVLSVFVRNNTVYVGGHYTAIGGQVRPNFAAFTVAGAPIVTVQPRGQTAPTGSNILLSVGVIGKDPLTYRWQKDGVDLPDGVGATLSIPGVNTGHAGEYRVVVSNSMGVAVSAAARLTVLTPPFITSQPEGKTVAIGENAEFRVVAGGSPPLAYQWQLNGMNLPGQTNDTIRLSNIQGTNAGTYRVAVANRVGATNSQEAAMTIKTGGDTILQDYFEYRQVVGGQLRGSVSGSNVGASHEPREPSHAGKPASRSMWLGWRAPGDGIATFDTIGSSFDTVLAVYTGSEMADLIPLASDEDGGNFFTSLVKFNVQEGEVYQIAVDGFGGDTGNILLNWSFTATPDDVPQIFESPASQTVSLNSKVTLAVKAYSQQPLTYQWYYNKTSISGAVGDKLVIPSLQADGVGVYTVVVKNTKQSASATAYVEIGPEKRAITEDKLKDVTGESTDIQPQSLRRRANVVTVAAGALGTQVFDNITSTKEQGEPNHAGVVGGASRWFPLHMNTAGMLVADTVGSDIDTVMAVYTGTDFDNLRLEAEDDDGAPDGMRSKVKLPVTPGDYLVAVDGKNGVTGNVKLNWRLGVIPTIVQPVADQTVVAGGQAVFSVQVGGTNVVSYQWSHEGVPIPGATNATLIVESAQTDDAGRYRVRVENFAGLRDSSAELKVVSDTPPVANSQVVTTREDTATAVILGGTDIVGRPLHYVVVSPPLHGQISGTAPNLTYTPASRYHGLDRFTFKVNNGAMDSAAATVDIVITPAGAVSELRLSIAKSGAGQMVVKWSAVSGRRYQVQYKNKLSEAAWISLADVVATGPLAAITNNVTGQSQGYYRVVETGGAAGTIVLTISKSGGGQVVLNWSATSGTHYQVLYKSNLTQAAWIDLAEVVAAGPAASFTNSVFGQPQGYFLVMEGGSPAPAIRILSISSPAKGFITLIWSAVDGQRYQVQYKNKATDAGWSELAEIVAGDTTASYTEYIPGQPQRFYRIEWVQ